MESLSGLKVAILVEDGFEQVEVTEPREALDRAGAETRIVSPRSERVRGWNSTDWGDTLPVDVPLDEAQAQDFDALLLPGGVMNPDALRMQPAAVGFVRGFFDAGKPVAAICHAPWTLDEAGVVDGRTLTSWPSLQTDIRNAGGTWVDEQVFSCTAGPNVLITSRKPDDLPAFCDEFLKAFAATST